ncbi:PREDICTED: alpha-2C adrenergic receptor-like [Branchiostoma belcheri]|uniref:Alpha-2C adrenergic receptor-like n=1 Tax=Branchiostoma belcheri TaxID=7741 RepID=A0A6P5AA59_BRABE|nr:PREDICTED: alpha-2C adrenergic receptor-like [Branchiostoma belcheri]
MNDSNSSGLACLTDGPVAPATRRYTLGTTVVLSVLVSITVLLSITGNIFICVAVTSERKLRSVHNRYLVSLAVSDLMVGLVIMPPALVTELLGYWFFGEALCGVFLAVDIFACTASIINLCAISLDRYWSVARPADYRRQGLSRKRVRLAIVAVWVTSAAICLPSLVGWTNDMYWSVARPADYRRQGLSRKRVRLAIVAVWVTSAAICLPSLVGWTNDMYIDNQQLPQCEYTNNIGYVVYSTVGSFYLPLVIMTVAYVRVCWAVKDRILRNQRRKMIPLKTLNGNNKRKEAAIAEGVSGNICHTTDEKDSDDQLEEAIQDEENRNVLTVPPDGVRRTAGRSRHQQQSGGTELQHGGNTRLLCCRKESDPDENTKSTTERTQKSTQRSCAENGKEKQNGPNNLLLSAVVLHERSLLSFSVSSATTSSLPNPHRPGDCSKLEKRLSLPELRDTKTVDQPESGVRPEGNTRSMEYMVIVHPPPSAEEQNQQEAPPPTSKSLTTTPKKKVNMLSPHVRKQRDCRRRIEIEHDLEDLTSTFSNIAHNDLIIKDDKELSKLHRLVHCHNPNVLRKRLMGNRDRRLIVVVGIIMSVFVLCWLPFFLTYVVQTACGSCDVPEPLFKFFTWLGYCNSSLNPVLYTIFNRDFRKVFYKKILRRELAK